MNFNNNLPIYIQIVNEIKLYVISGKLRPGDRLLSVREYALLFKVNPNTMQKALIELENEKLIYTERTNGKYVTANELLINKIKKEYASNVIKEYFKKMNDIGINKDTAINFINEKRDK